MFIDENIFKINHPQPALQPGVVLLAEPFLKESYFFKSAVLLIEHDPFGSMGLVLNKRTSLTLNQLYPAIEKTDLPPIPIFCGGPVDHRRLFFLHKFGEQIPFSKYIGFGIYIGGDFDALLYTLKRSDSNIYENVLFCLGYSGWDAGQLQQETDESTWVITEPDKIDFLICHQEDEFWRHSIRNLDISYRRWLSYPHLPDLN